MSNSQRNIRLQKRVLQFNNLVFSYDENSTISYTSSFKGESVPYTNALHGSYYPNFGEWGKLETSEIEVELVFDFRHFNSENDYIRYMRFIKRELGRSGKLWAVQGGSEVVWANARVLSINEVNADYETNKLHLSVQFELIDGFWVLASQTRTFLADYDVKDFVDFDTNYCYSLSDLAGGCDRGLSCFPCNKVEQEHNYPNDTAYRPLCQFSKAELTKMLSVSCPGSYIIKYDCDMEADRFCYDTSWGERKRLRKTALNYGNTTEYTFCSRTDIPTELVRVTLVGSFENPSVTINDRTVTISGSFQNQAITIGEGLNVSLSDDIRAPYSAQTSLVNQTTFSGVPYFQMNPGVNTIKVTGNKYGENSFVYLQPVELSY